MEAECINLGDRSKLVDSEIRRGGNAIVLKILKRLTMTRRFSDCEDQYDLSNGRDRILVESKRVTHCSSCGSNTVPYLVRRHDFCAQQGSLDDALKAMVIDRIVGENIDGVERSFSMMACIVSIAA